MLMYKICAHQRLETEEKGVQSDSNTQSSIEMIGTYPVIFLGYL